MTKEVNQTIKGDCPNCGQGTNSDVLASSSKRWDDEQAPVWVIWEYRILKCRGCDEVYFQTTEYFSENSDIRTDPASGEAEEYIRPEITHWPERDKFPEPSWLGDLDAKDAQLYLLCSELYSALNRGLNILAAVGIRTALDRSTENFGIDSSLSFRKKLEMLETDGIIGSREKAVLELVTEAGHAAAHRAWKPTDEQLSKLINVLEAYLRRIFITDTEADASLRGQVPGRNLSRQRAAASREGEQN